MTSIRSDLTGAKIQSHIRYSGQNIQDTIKKLSSGKRITQAADDASGLAVSTRLTAKAKGDRESIQNVLHGKSLVQTADAGLASISEMLMRLKEIAVQARNGTYSMADKNMLNKEFSEIIKSMDKVANGTSYNGIPLLNVTAAAPTPPPPSGTPVTIDLSRATSITIYEYTGSLNTITVSIGDLVSGFDWLEPNDGIEKYRFSVDLATSTFTSRAIYEPGDDTTSKPANNIAGIRVNGLTGYDVTDAFASVLYSYTPGPFMPSMPPYNFGINSVLGSDISMGSTVFYDVSSITADTQITVQFQAADMNPPAPPANPDFFIHSGYQHNNTYDVVRSDVRTSTLGISALNVFDPNVIQKIDQTIDAVSSERSKYGTYENMFEHKVNYLSSSVTQADRTNSRISDADMAAYSSQSAKEQISFQKSTALLKKSNDHFSSVLQLLAS